MCALVICKVWKISDIVVVICSHDLWVVSKSNLQFKTPSRVTLIRDNVKLDTYSVDYVSRYAVRHIRMSDELFRHLPARSDKGDWRSQSKLSKSLSMFGQSIPRIWVQTVNATTARSVKLFYVPNIVRCRSRSSLARTLGSWVWIPLKAWMSVLCAFILCLCCPVCR
jgi:hypothetical protein